jgi:uncharacterized repeat protein (TIGR03803 family)
MRPSRFFAVAFASSALFMTLLGVSAAQMKVLYNFNGTLGSNPPEIALIQGRDGQIYGTASYGGTYSLGSILKVTTAGQVTALHDFSGTDGQYPEAGLTLGGRRQFLWHDRGRRHGQLGCSFQDECGGGRYHPAQLQSGRCRRISPILPSNSGVGRKFLRRDELWRYQQCRNGVYHG